MTNKGNGISRRNFIIAGSGLLAAPAVLRATSATAASNQLTFVTWGGTYKDALVEGAIKSFTEQTGVQVTIIDTPDLAKVKAQVSTGNVQWDVFDAPSAIGTGGAAEGYWDDFDDGLFDLNDLTLAPSNNLVPFYTYAGGIAYDPKRHPEGSHPTTFAEYFDVEKFPGRRTFRDRPSETLEAALLADGVAPKDLYPLDVDRAFAALDRVKPSVASWVGATPQTVTLLQTGEVDFSYSYAARVRAAQTDNGGLAFSFAQTINASEYLAVLKGAPNRENAMKFVSHMLKPEVQAATMEILAYTPNSKTALPLMSEDARKWLPDMNNPNNVILDDAWWAENFESVTRRFKEWILM
ncbi:ABC transporter substrate-binding protein [Pseudorhizobium endolithicum]|uniref:ABC transporter substrate-binding protein n=1 Tax=Pseudorhizobium endolithicum TaxID=1191678 RepID=A0ABM8PMA7_9HYPH|nr:ABC transporter substrate-binding protein [Pseudorhizobium endolithicum]CAD7037682.1 ABC transporter substrate-binding protein [Pseudorhizobium endolithicum]